ncbi:MAG: branched-chain amino acid ABC transporter permease [Desulfobacteraceae bacterium]|nr:branched-chain amino acid ABC transporter permease [Desulfobacteraceae bacterium]
MTFLADLSMPIVMGILLGGLYAVIALGLSLIFGVVKEINIAHGDLVILGSYFGYVSMTVLGIDPILSLIIGMPLLFGIGFGIQKYLLNRAFKISMDATLIIAFGVSIILQNVYQLIWSPMSRGLTTSYALESFSAGPISLPLVYLLDFTAAIVVMLFLREFLRRTYTGMAIRAAAQDWRAAHLMGINTDRVFAITFGIATALAAIAGVFLGLTFPFTPVSGTPFLIIALGVVVLGGMGSIAGTLVGGIVFGLAQTLGGYFFGLAAQMLVAYTMLLVVLAVIPRGIFGR